MEFITEAKVTNMLLNVDYYMNPVVAFLVYFSCGVLTVCFKGMCLWHTVKYAPKGRPINWMTFCDQVSCMLHRLYSKYVQCFDLSFIDES